MDMHKDLVCIADRISVYYRRNKRKLYEEFARCQTLYGEVCEAYFEKRKNAKTELVFSEYM